MHPEESEFESPRLPISGDGIQFERFSRRLIGLARTHLRGQLKNRVDPEDVVQSAYKSLFLRYGEGVLASEGWQGLWGLLTVITLRKCADRARYYATESRNSQREVDTQPRSVDSTPWFEAVGREPTPEEAAMLAETVGRLVSGLGDDDRIIVELSLQGFSTAEISEQTGRAERSVRRLRERIRKQLESLSSESACLEGKLRQ